MSDLLTPAELAAIAEREAKAMEGPWYWRCGSKHPTTLYGSRTNIVMDTTGIRGATLRFWVKGVMHKASDFFSPRKGQEHNASFMSDIDHPDAQFIAHARADIPALLRHIAALEARTPAPDLREAIEISAEAERKSHLQYADAALQEQDEALAKKYIGYVFPMFLSKEENAAKEAIARQDQRRAIAHTAEQAFRAGARCVLRHQRTPAPADDPEMDGTDFAHPAWWRGHDHTTAMFCHAVNEILDGKDDGVGVNAEGPWRDTRQRLLALVGKPAPSHCQCAECKPWLDAEKPAPALPADMEALLAEAEDEAPVAGSFRDLIQRLATALRESRAREQAEPYRHALEQRLICSNLPLLTGNADADLMRFVFHEQEIALSPEAGVIAELKEQRDTALSWTATYTNMDVYRRCLAAAIARAEKAEAERDAAKGLLSLSREEHDASILENALLESQIVALREAEKDHLASAASEQESMYTLRENYDSVLKRAIRAEGRATRAENENVSLVEKLATKEGVIQNWMNLHDEAIERADTLAADLAAARAELARLGPVEWEASSGNGWGHVTESTRARCQGLPGWEFRAIRVVKEAQ